MSFKIKTHGKMGEAIRKLARKEISKAIAELNPESSTELAEAAHNARKHFKKLRAMLRFVRAELGDDSYRTENACFRDAGRKLCGLRDAQVLVSSIDQLRSHFLDGKPAPFVTLARKSFAQSARQALEKTARDGALKEVTALLREALSRVESWRLEEFGWKEARCAIQRSYRQSRRAHHVAEKDPTVENLHEWRKRAKDFWYHARLLRRATPEILAELSDEVEALTEFIGDDHDLATLREALRSHTTPPQSAKQMEAFLAMLDTRRGELQHAAFALANRLFASRPSRFADRLDKERKLRRKTSRTAEELGEKLAE